MRVMNDEEFEKRSRLANDGRVMPAHYLADCLEYIDFLKETRAELLQKNQDLHSEHYELKHKFQMLELQLSSKK